MFKKFYLVELFGTNGVKSSRSNCVLTTRGSTPPIEIAYQNMFDHGFNSVNVLSCTRINKKTADFIRDHINNKERYENKTVGEMVSKIQEQMNKSGGTTQSTKITTPTGPTDNPS